MSRVVNVTTGADEYIGALVRELTGKDISTDTFEVALGGRVPRTVPAAGDWKAADLVTGVGSQISVYKRINASTTVGEYSLWVRITDTPEIVPRYVDDVLVQ